MERPGQIAYPLEMIAREFLGKDEKEIRETFLSADDIQNGTFVETMLFLLRQKHGLCKDYSEFARKAQPLFGKMLKTEDKELASILFADFTQLFK